jgi:alanine racemase
MNRIEQLLTWCHGTWLYHHNDVVIQELVIDSRHINNPDTTLFIALKTKHRDGHDFIANAYEKGVRNFLVQHIISVSDFPAANFILVNDTLLALQQIVAAHRNQFHIPVVGVTGSNGKTIVKEWLFQLLSSEFNIVRSPKSYNSQLGVPLSVWLLEKQHQLGIFEAGISQPDEMEQLEKIVQPTIGIFTNIGEAHSEGFQNLTQKVKEKLRLFLHVKHLVYCSDYPMLNECIAQYFHDINKDHKNGLQLFTWSHKHEAGLYIERINKSEGKTTITAIYKGNTISITIPFTDPASVENAIHCWCVMLLLNVAQQKIQELMPQLQPVAMRLELRHGINDSTIINDSYNSDLTSLVIALDYLVQQKQHTRSTVILSDMLQIGKPDTELYEEVAALISRRNIQRFIGIGSALYKHKAAFRAHKKLHSVFFKSTEDFLKKLHLISFEEESILLKGARVFSFEKIATLLEQKIHQTVLSINLSALKHNLDVFRSHLQSGVKTMAMVKAFSYGSGSFEIAHLLQFAGVDYLSVAYTDEGITLRKAGITMPIMVMSPDAISFDRMIAWKLEPEIFNIRSLQLFMDMAHTLQVTDYPIHIKLDTGMHRLGFMPNEIEELLTALKDNTYVRVAGIFSHLAGSEDAQLNDFTQQQATTFTTVSEQIIAGIGYTSLRHLCNSAAVALHPHLHFDMVRLGLGLYGIDSSGVLQDKLLQISTLKSTIAQIKEIPVGETVGYGRKGVANNPLRIATICIGYADGYPRSLGNGIAHVLINDKPAKTVGVICMDMCMVDITDIPEAKEGDEVVIFSPQLPLTQLSRWAGTIPYELMTGISQRVKRVYVNEG